MDAPRFSPAPHARGTFPAAFTDMLGRSQPCRLQPDPCRMRAFGVALGRPPRSITTRKPNLSQAFHQPAESDVSFGTPRAPLLLRLRIVTKEGKRRRRWPTAGFAKKAGLLMVSLRSSSDILLRPGRTIAIGDIHGCASALRTLLAEIGPTPNDTLVTLGDYVDRGPDSRGVLDTLIELKSRCRLVPLLGNHEQMLFSARASQMMCKHWLRFGGDATLRSFGPLGLSALTPQHLTFLEGCHMHFETPTHLFVHANYDPTRPIDQQDEDTALSLSLRESLPGPHVSGKTVIVGHTPQKSGEILDLGYLKCLDTNCCEGGYLTAMDVGSGQTWRTKELGLQRCSLMDVAHHLSVVPPTETSTRQG